MAAAAPAEPPLRSGLTMLAPPATIALGQGPMPVTGYRSARFGMTPDQVRAAVATDFGRPVAQALHDVTVEPGFAALSTSATTIFDRRPVELRYVFREGALVTVNLLVRTGPAPRDAERAALVDLARGEAARLLGHDWRLFSTMRGRPTGANSVLVAAVTDDLGNGANIELDGVTFTAKFDDGSERVSPPPKGAASLRIAFARDIDNRFVLAPDAFVAEQAPFRISGLRSVRFGMTENEVRPLAARDLRVLPGAIQRVAVADEGTTALVAGALRLDPGPTPATISYVFGARSRKLVQIVVQWAYPSSATAPQRRSISEAGLFLAAALRAAGNAAPRHDNGGAASASDLILYRAWDGSGANLALTMSGVAFDRVAAGQRIDGPPPTGPAALRLAYTLDPEHPDVAPVAAQQGGAN